MNSLGRLLLMMSVFAAGCREVKTPEISMVDLAMKEDGRYYQKGGGEAFSGIGYHETEGKRISQSVFVNGFREGEHLVFWPESGQKRTAGTYREGFRDGLFTEWNEDGVKLSESTYRDGVLEGPFRAWFPNGGLREEGEYEDGDRSGEWIAYYSDPELEYQDPDTLKKFEETSYEEGKLHGMKRSWSVNGLLVYEGGYEQGQMNGRHETWYPTGVNKESFFYEMGRPMGRHREWHPNGQLKYDAIFGPDGSPSSERFWGANGKETDRHPDEEIPETPVETPENPDFQPGRAG